MTRSLMMCAAVALLAWGGAAAQSAQKNADAGPPVAPQQKPAFPGQTEAPLQPSNLTFDVTTVAEGLVEPWGMALLPDGRMLVTEKPGRLRIVATDGKLSEPVAGLPMVAYANRSQGGLLDVSLDPAYAKNNLIYWSYTEPQDGKNNNTAVARGRLVDGAMPRVDNVQVIYRQTPSFPSNLHFGSRLVWRRDGTLFVTQGERSDVPGRMQAQKMDSGLGKIMRINADGSVPKDNPFVGKPGVLPEIWSFGHRNVQAATLHPTTGELWEVEHGTNGGDEFNIAEKGKDYGWPTIAYGMEYRGGPINEGIQVKAGMEQPKYYWDPNIAPSGMVIYTGDLFPGWKGNALIGGLRGQALVRLVVDPQGKVTGEERLLTDLKERIRDVEQAPDGSLHLLTDNAKGRLLRVIPKL